MHFGNDLTIGITEGIFGLARGLCRFLGVRPKMQDIADCCDLAFERLLRENPDSTLACCNASLFLPPI
jgi:hypothetical protein